MTDRAYLAAQAVPVAGALLIVLAVAAGSPGSDDERPVPDARWQLEECRSGWYMDRAWRIEYKERSEDEHARRLREVDAARESCERRVHGVEARAAGEVVCHGDECANEVCWDAVLECRDRLEEERKQFVWDLRFKGCDRDRADEMLDEATEEAGGDGP